MGLVRTFDHNKRFYEDRGLVKTMLPFSDIGECSYVLWRGVFGSWVGAEDLVRLATNNMLLNDFGRCSYRKRQDLFARWLRTQTRFNKNILLNKNRRKHGSYSKSVS